MRAPTASKQVGFFSRFAQGTARAVGHPGAFGIAALIVTVWAVSGPFFQFSNTWQLLINTTTTIVTVLMVFLIQHTQNRDSIAMQVKLDELIRTSKGAHNALMDLEELTPDELDAIRRKYEALAERARERLRMGKRDTDTPELEFDPKAEEPAHVVQRHKAEVKS